MAERHIGGGEQVALVSPIGAHDPYPIDTLGIVDGHEGDVLSIGRERDREFE